MENIAEKILNEILKDTFTLESYKKRVMALKRSLEGKLYSPGSEKPEAQGRDVPERPENGWTGSFNQKILDEITSKNFQEVFEKIEGFIANGANLTIYFVFIPDEAQIREIGVWLRKSLNSPQLIFDVKVDPGLIGGCAIAYKGVYKDYSLKAKISGNKEKLIEEFRRYFKS